MTHTKIIRVAEKHEAHDFTLCFILILKLSVMYDNGTVKLYAEEIHCGLISGNILPSKFKLNKNFISYY